MKTSSLTKTAIMVVLVFLATYLIKVPVAGGYYHLGDGIIILGVVILGSKKGAAAAGIGAALSDLLSGPYAIWAGPTLVIKSVMALIMGVFMVELFPKKRYGWVIGATFGGLFQIVAYTFTEMLFYGVKTALVEIPGNVIQTVVGIVVAGVLIKLLRTSGTLDKIKVL